MGLSVAFDLATHRGYDSDHPRVPGDVGMAGVAIDSILDMRTLFDGIPLDKMSVSMTMNGAVLPVLALYIVAAEEQGVPHAKLVGHDPERHPQGVPGPEHLHLSARALDADHRRHLRLHLAARCRSSTRSRSAATTCRKPARPLDLELGLHPGRRRRVRARRRRRRHDVDQFAPRLSFFWSAGMNFFMEVAKLRAGRLLWAKLMKAVRPEGRPLAGPAHPHARPSGWSLTAQDVFNNVAAHLRSRPWPRRGGQTQSLHTNSLDEALALPTDFSARIARNTQLFLQLESGHDPGRSTRGAAATTSSA